MKKERRMIEPSEPMNGECQSCGRITTVRAYPYNEHEALGILCEECFNRIDSELMAVDRNCAEENEGFD